MKFTWCKNIVDLVAWNSGKIEEVDLDEYSEMLEELHLPSIYITAIIL
jgi:hypothetical protein